MRNALFGMATLELLYVHFSRCHISVFVAFSFWPFILSDGQRATEHSLPFMSILCIHSVCPLPMMIII